MRRLLIALLLCSCAIAQNQDKEAKPAQGPDFSRAARERGAFYLNGIGHQYIQGRNFTVVAAAIPTLNGKYFGVKLHVFNRGKESVNMLPESVTVEDSVGIRQLELFSAAEIADHMRKQPTWMRVAGAAVGGAPAPPMPGNDPGVPTMADLLRELSKDAGGSGMAMGYTDASYPTLTVRGTPKAVAHSSEACDLGCELRNREIGDGSGPQLQQRSARPEQVEQSEFLANTIPPEGDVEGVLYFAMPKLTDRAPISHTGKKSYLVTVTVPVGEEKFQFVFPPE
ncbi:MAG: hypothetical protein WBS19_22670 [Candidatus Korobacteraceae bacterium]